MSELALRLERLFCLRPCVHGTIERLQSLDLRRPGGASLVTVPPGRSFDPAWGEGDQGAPNSRESRRESRRYEDVARPPTPRRRRLSPARSGCSPGPPLRVPVQYWATRPGSAKPRPLPAVRSSRERPWLCCWPSLAGCNRTTRRVPLGLVNRVLEGQVAAVPKVPDRVPDFLKRCAPQDTMDPLELGLEEILIRGWLR